MFVRLFKVRTVTGSILKAIFLREDWLKSSVSVCIGLVSYMAAGFWSLSSKEAAKAVFI
jgi:hypothetical protein